MLYIHQYFTVDTEKKKIFDENRKELLLAGNAYRLLEFMCEKYPNSVTISDINDYFEFICAKEEHLKEYNEDYIRQLRNIIRHAISRDVIEYKNFVYSIIGELKKEADTISFKKIAKQSSNIETKTDKINLIWLKFWANKIKIIKMLLILLIVLGFFISIGIFSKTKNRFTAPLQMKEDMVLIPAGEFIMGNTENKALDAFKLCKTEETTCSKDDYLVEYPQRIVYLKDFYIDKKEISNEEYNIFVEKTKHRLSFYSSNSNLNSLNQPVVGVSWDDANVYCQWLGKRLPTEEEWEKAAGGLNNYIWPWGNEWNLTKSNHGKKSYEYDESDGYKYTAPVGVSLGVSPYGALNIAGNVFEWVNDDFKAYPGNDKFIHKDFGSLYKVMKGGSYYYGKAYERVASRMYEQPEYRDEDLGFRCAKDK